MTTEREATEKSGGRRRRRARRRRRRQVRLRRGAYLLPSLFTIGNILLGFHAVVRGLAGEFEAAAVSIFVAGILDGFDGRLARLLKTESDFGREFDSLADVLTFGAAPAYLAYVWGLEGIGRVGWLVPVFFVISSAVRLARFNVQTTASQGRDFVGLPAPAAAGAIASFLFIAPDSEWKVWLGAAMLLSLVAVGTLMVSTFRYPSFKKIDLRRPRSYRVALPLAAGILVFAVHPPAFFLSAAVVYTLYGPASWLLGRLRRSEASGQVESARTP